MKNENSPPFFKLMIGPWKNELGSIMTIEKINSKGELSGIYQTNAGPIGLSIRDKFPLTGLISKNLLKFSVYFHGYHSVTTWIGEIKSRPSELIIISDWTLTFYSWGNSWSPFGKTKKYFGSNKFIKSYERDFSNKAPYSQYGNNTAEWFKDHQSN